MQPTAASEAARAAKVLKQPVPDTFLGRRTHEPFKLSDEEAERWANPPGLQPPR